MMCQEVGSKGLLINAICNFKEKAQIEICEFKIPNNLRSDQVFNKNKIFKYMWITINGVSWKKR